MIVTCTSCQARFRIPDERIGPKGAKVRCSKCKNVFVAKPAAGPGGAGAPGGPPDDPFAKAQPAADPFAPSPPFAPDPFAPTAAGKPGPDPFAAPAPPSGSRTGAFHLPVTDLSDLEGGLPAAPSPSGPSALAPPLPAAPAAPAADAGPAEAGTGVANADDLVLEEPSRAIPMAPPPLHPTSPGAPGFDFGASRDLAEPVPVEPPGPAPKFEFGAPGTDLGEALEPVPGLEPAAVPGGVGFTGADPFAAEGAALPLAGEGPAAEGMPRIPTITEPLPPDKPPAPVRPIIAARRKVGAARDVGPLSAPAPRGPLQGFLANALSLAALLAVAAGLLSWWVRDVGPPERAAGARGPVAAVETSSGLYETATGTPVLFVRGEVLSRHDAPLGRVAVRAELLVGGEVRARAEGLAGAVPTPEEVAQIGGPEDAARLRARVAARAPARLDPGATLPFLVVFDVVPEGFRDAVVRVAAEPLAGDRLRAP